MLRRARLKNTVRALRPAVAGTCGLVAAAAFGQTPLSAAPAPGSVAAAAVGASSAPAAAAVGGSAAPAAAAPAKDPPAAAPAKDPTAAPTAAAAAAAKDPKAAVLTITAKGYGVPISKAEVAVGTVKSYTDPNGTVSILVPETGAGHVTVTRKGYAPLDIPFEQLRPPGAFAVRLLPGAPDDDVIVVTGKRNDTAVSRTSISIEEAAKVAPGGDPAQVIKLLPGVQSAGAFSSQVIIQGSGPHDSRYFIDDLETPFIFHNIDNLSVIPGEFMAAVDFESAGFGTEYGDATGGIVTIRTKTDIPERPQTIITFNVPFYAGISHTQALSPDSSLTVGVRRSYIDYFLREFLSRRNKRSGDTSGNLTLSPYFSDGEIQYLKKDDSGYTKFSIVGAYDGITAVVPTSSAENETGQSSFGFSTRFIDIGVERNTRLNHDWKLSTTPQIYYYQTAAQVNSYNLQSDEEKLRVPTYLTKRLGEKDKLYLGMDPQYITAKTDIFAPQFQANDPTFDPEEAPSVKTDDYEHFVNVATWAAVDQNFGPLTLTPGVRAFYNSQIKRTSADPRLRARYVLSDQHTLKGAVGQYSESPQPLAASASRGNPHLDYMKAMHYVVGLESKWGEDWSTNFDVYYKTIRNVIESDAETLYDNGGKTRSRGFEALIRRNLTGRLFGWISYTWSKTQEQPTADAAWRNAEYDQTNVLALVGDYKLTGTWDVGGRYDYNTGDTYDVVDAAVFNANLDKYEPRPASNGVNAGRAPNFNSLTLYITHDFLYDTWKLAMRFGMEQYWFKPQVQQVSYNYNYTKLQSETGLTSIPFFELKGEF